MFSSSNIPTTTILNVDDYPISREAISLILKQEGFASIEVESGAEALRYVTEARPGPTLPDLVLLDVNLPDITGYEVCRLLKQNHATAAIPVLMISGVLDKVEDKARGLDSGADGYLTKPVEPLELIATIKALLRIRRAEKEARAEAEAARRRYQMEETRARYDQPVSEASMPSRMAPAENQEERLAVNDTSARSYCGLREKTLPLPLREPRPHGDVVKLEDYIAAREIAGRNQLERTERADKAECTMIESDSLNRAILSSLPANIAVLDRHGNIIAVNDAWERFNRENSSSGDDLCHASLGQNYLTICENAAGEQSEGLHVALDGIRAVLKRERNEFIMEYPCHSPETPQWFLLSVSSLPEKLGGAVVWRLDITARVLAEEERARLLEREQEALVQAEAVSRMKDEFLTTASHELRAPLHAILGWAKLLRGNALSPEDVARALETIERSVLTQSQIISDLLDVSEVITGKLMLDVCPFDPIPVIEAAIDIVRPAAEAKKVSIEAALDTTIVEIMGDADRLRQIIWHLVSNGVKFTPQGGKVTILLRRSEALLPNLEEIEIVVQDSGAGISPEFLPYVFDPFRQADGSRTRKYGGLGLGLAIVRRLAELHGGTAFAESPGENQGATFTVRLPVVSPYHWAESAIEAGATIKDFDPELKSVPKLEGVRILVVDDEPDCATLTGYLLSQWGADVKTVISAADALDIFARPDLWSPDILISDIHMPGMDGYSLMRKVREIELDGSRNIPAIALTAYTRAEDRIRALDAGFHIQVSKPIEPAELLAVVESLANWQN